MLPLSKALNKLEALDEFPASMLDRAEDEVRRMTANPDPLVTMRDARRLVGLVDALYDIRTNVNNRKVEAFILSRILGGAR